MLFIDLPDDYHCPEHNCLLQLQNQVQYVNPQNFFFHFDYEIGYQNSQRNLNDDSFSHNINNVFYVDDFADVDYNIHNYFEYENAKCIFDINNLQENGD